jgi:prepilin peptidase CpaA
MTAPCLRDTPAAESRGSFRAGACALGIALGAGAGVALGAVAPIRPLPTSSWAAAFLFCVVWQDVWRRRIPNVLTVPALLACWLGAGLAAGLPAALHSLAGSALAIALLFVPFAFRGMGAGDLKAAAVIGALWGPAAALAVVFWAVVLAGAGALGWLALRGGLQEMGKRWFHSLGLTLALCRPVYLAPAPGTAAAGGLPFGVALALGAIAYGGLGAPWSA